MMKRNLVLFCILVVGLSMRMEAVDKGLLRDCAIGSPRQIERVCMQRVQDEFKLKSALSLKGDVVKTLLQGEDLRQTCYMARLMGMVAQAKVSDLPEMKDAEFRVWFFQHPEIAEDMVFSRRMGKQSFKSFYKLRVLWLVLRSSGILF